MNLDYSVTSEPAPQSRTAYLRKRSLQFSIPRKKRGNQKFLTPTKGLWKLLSKKCQSYHQHLRRDGTVTAGNASGINDAAAAVLLMKEEECRQLGLKPLARILGFASGAVDPAYMGLGLIPAREEEH